MNRYILPIFLTFIFIFIQVLTLQDYGINWDAPYRMLRGSLYSQFYTHDWNQKVTTASPILINPGEYASRYDFLDGEEGELVKKPQQLQISPTNKEAYIKFLNQGHPPLVDVLAGFSNIFFHHLLGEIASYQIVYILLSAVGVFIVAIFTYEITGSYTALFVSACAMAMYPLFFSESHFNMKDPLQASMFAGAIWSLWHWLKDSKKIWAALLGLFIVLALNIKWNIVFLPLIIVPWLLTIRKTDAFKNWFNYKTLIIFTFATFLAFIVVLTIFSPANWTNPVGYFNQLITYYWSAGTQAKPIQPPGFILPFGFNVYPILLLIFQTPEVLLFLVLMAMVSFFKKKKLFKLQEGVLLSLWLIVPLIRISLPHVWFYNGLRQIMEVIPAIAILSGIGAHFLMKRKNLAYFIVLLIFLLLLQPLWSFHPNENMYFNHLIGGLKGAVNKNLVDKKISYGNIYKQAANWLNVHTEQNAKIAFLDGPMYALSHDFLRDDITASPFYFSDFDQKGEYIVAPYDPENPAIFAQRYPKHFLKPAYQIIVDKVPMATIYKNSLQSLVSDMKNQVQTTSFKTKTFFSRGTPALEIDLGGEVRVTRISLEHVSSQCQPYYGQYIDEFVDFSSDNNRGEQPQFDKMYGLQERKKSSNGTISILYPGERGRYIRVYPQSNTSCFFGGRISSISYISDK